MKTFHLIFGITVVIIFLLTGQYMDRYLNHLADTPDLQRMFYRSRHIYILLAGLLNLGLGSYFTWRKERWRRVLQTVGSVLIILATIFFVIAFIFEPRTLAFHTPFSGWAMYSIFAGTLFQVISSVRAIADQR